MPTVQHTAGGRAVIETKNLWFRYSPSQSWVLRGVDLVVEPGEVVLILGASGSGKTTLLRAITGIGTSVYGAEVVGDIILGGRRIEDLTLEEIRRVVQVVNQNAYTHFIEHVVGLDLYYSSIAIHGPSVGERVFRKVVNTFKLSGLLKRRFFELSGGQLRRAAVAKAMLWDPRAVVLDEPLMWLDDEGLEEIREVIITARSLGKAVVAFEHRFLGLLDLASRIFLLKEGSLTPVEHGELRHPRGVPSKAPLGPGQGYGEKSVEGGKTAVRATGIWFKYEDSEDWILRGVDLDVTSVEDTVVIYGRNGSGKSTLLKLLAGYLNPTRGRIERLSGVRVVYVPQNVYLFFTEESLGKEFEVYCSQTREGRACVERGTRVLKSLGVDLEVDASPFNLSWGQAVRAAVSIAVSTGSDALLLMDEPFTGLTYADRLSLTELLAKINVPKVITLSNRETLSLVSWARTYEVRDGHLTRIEPEVDPSVIEAAEKCRALGISGAS